MVSYTAAMSPRTASLVGTVCTLCRRPRLFTPTGSLEEVVAYFAGCCDAFRLSDDDRSGIPMSWRFTRWLCERHGVAGTIDPAGLCAVLSRLSPEPIKALWDEFELFADAHLGVPRGTYPLKITEMCGHACGCEAPRPEEARTDEPDNSDP